MNSIAVQTQFLAAQDEMEGDETRSAQRQMEDLTRSEPCQKKSGVPVRHTALIELPGKILPSDSTAKLTATAQQRYGS